MQHLSPQLIKNHPLPTIPKTQPSVSRGVDKINQVGPHNKDLLMNYTPYRYENVAQKQEPQIDTIPAPR